MSVLVLDPERSRRELHNTSILAPERSRRVISYSSSNMFHSYMQQLCLRHHPKLLIKVFCFFHFILKSFPSIISSVPLQNIALGITNIHCIISIIIAIRTIKTNTPSLLTFKSCNCVCVCVCRFDLNY